jgi:Zn-finger nucleic acid-binding protein
MSEAAAAGTCPKCKTALQPLEERDVPFLGCTTCSGLFVTARYLHEYVVRATAKPVGDAFTALLDAAMGGKMAPSVRKCPTCAETLHRLGFGEAPFVVLDLCMDHGLWLDKKELKKVLRSSRAHAGKMGLVAPFVDDDADDEDDD